MAFDILAECWHRLAKSGQNSGFQEQCLSCGIWTCVKNFVSSTLWAQCFPTRGKWDLPEQTKTRIVDGREKHAIDKRNSEIVKTFPLAPHVLPGYVFFGHRRTITKYVRLETLLRNPASRQKISLKCIYAYRNIKIRKLDLYRFLLIFYLFINLYLFLFLNVSWFGIKVRDLVAPCNPRILVCIYILRGIRMAPAARGSRKRKSATSYDPTNPHGSSPSRRRGGVIFDARALRETADRSIVVTLCTR